MSTVPKPDHISQEDWDAVDSPPLTERMLKGMRPCGTTLKSKAAIDAAVAKFPNALRRLAGK